MDDLLRQIHALQQDLEQAYLRLDDLTEQLSAEQQANDKLNDLNIDLKRRYMGSIERLKVHVHPRSLEVLREGMRHQEKRVAVLIGVLAKLRTMTAPDFEDNALIRYVDDLLREAS